MVIDADVADPRSFPDRVNPAFDLEIERAAASLASMSVSGADVQDTALTEKMIDAMRTGGGEWLASLLAAAPSAAIARTLQRRMIAAWDEAVADGPAGVAAQLFALPIVIVAGKSSGSAPSLIEAVITEPERVRAILLEHAALAGNRNFALANALASADAIDLPRLPELLSWTHALDSSATQARSVEPAPIALSMEGAVHLRFLVGTALTAPRAPLFAESGVGAWGLPLARELARQLTARETSVLALPRAPKPPLVALQEGRAAQREVAAQLFASNAIRRLRSAVGEPAAVISAHRCPDTNGGGELRLSLSSAFDSRLAEGFRCPLFPGERASDVAAMLGALMRDCRVANVHVLPGVHPDHDPATGLTLLFKAELLEAEPRASLQ
ncbi:MAG TPA: hypothetical protein VMU79_15885 [Casimicrobiaceae bacterium]|nr:hypothetical protein [Casimicrobiaceae bacterium]